MTARILFVCTGNICRSPFAESYTAERLRLAGLSGLAQTTSVGSRALEGAACPDALTTRTLRYGIDLSRHSARSLNRDEIEGASLVLGLAREHRRAAIKTSPRAARYTFTLREFARLVLATPTAPAQENDTPRSLGEFVRVAASRRGTIPVLSDPVDDDVTDPFGHDGLTYDRSLEQVVEAVDSIVLRLAEQ